MATVNMPGFTAEASLYDLHAPYRTAGAVNAARGIYPAQFDDEPIPDLPRLRPGDCAELCGGFCARRCAPSPRPYLCLVLCFPPCFGACLTL